MSVPPLWKWRPTYSYGRTKGWGWYFSAQPHGDSKPLFLIQRWHLSWSFVFMERAWFWAPKGWRPHKRKPGL